MCISNELHLSFEQGKVYVKKITESSLELILQKILLFVHKTLGVELIDAFDLMILSLYTYWQLSPSVDIHS